LSLLLLAGAGGKTYADTIYNLTVGNAQLSGFPSPYGSVAVHLVDNTHATITFTTVGFGSGGTTYKFGGAQALDVNVNASTFIASGFSPSDLLPPPTAGNVSDFGNMNFTLDNFDGNTKAFTTGSFSLQNTSGTWASDANVLTSNGAPNNAFVAAHIFVYDATGANVKTGFAGGGTGNTVATPEPATIVSAAAGLMSLGFFRLRRRHQPVETTA